jgi:UTP--glucose-1-phosphate uridylyltransferase
MNNNIQQFIDKMKAEGLNELTIQSFCGYYYHLAEGRSGKLAEKDIIPPDSDNIVHYSHLQSAPSAPLNRLVVIKLNGGLGTSMGLTRAKSLLKVKGELSFLDIIARQILELREEKEIDIPLLFMHSFNTREDSLSYLQKYASLALKDIPLDFVQNKFPKIRKRDLLPLADPDEEKNWNPPGHGEIYSLLAGSGLLDKLMNRGYEYVFISNSDNLGAAVDEKILNYFADNKLPFLMEVCKRTEVDKKGGHLAQTRKGQLILRESAQCPADEMASFQDIGRYGYFNTNNLWVNLHALKHKLFEYNNLLPLQLILNEKNVDGEDVIQLETAMGAAISIFRDSGAILVGRERFSPVKRTSDLLAIWSDAYKLTDDYRLILNGRSKPPRIDLSDRYYRTIDQLNDHFEYGIPSLRRCNSLTIDADVYFGKGVQIVGDVKISKNTDLEYCTLEDEEVR